MYKECIYCPKLGTSCPGPKFFEMTAHDLIAWIKERKAHLKMSNARIAELANMSKGTVDSLLTESRTDFRYETIRPILKVLVGGEWVGGPCPDPTSSERAQMLEKVRTLEMSVQWRDEKINLITAENEHIAHEHQEMEKYLRSELKRKDKMMTGLSIALGCACVAIMAAMFLG